MYPSICWDKRGYSVTLALFIYPVVIRIPFISFPTAESAFDFNNFGRD